MNKKELKEEFNELIRRAREEHKESMEDQNSYGHGYDAGYWTALREVEQLIVALEVCKRCNGNA